MARKRESHQVVQTARRFRRSTLASLVLRPELTALLGTVAVFVFFAIDARSSGFLTWAGTSTYLDVAANLGILAAPVTLLLIAGEFDLSVGAAVGTTGVIAAYPVVNQGWPFWAGLLLSVVVAGVIGLANGLIVVYTPIPSLLVTLAMMFVLQGATLALTKKYTNQVSIFGVADAAKGDLVGDLFRGKVVGLPVSVVWWLALTLASAFLLQRTRFGNWIYAAGGNAASAVRAGVPIRRVKVMLFMATAVSATIVASISSLLVNEADVNRGGGMEFQALVAAVIGGSLLTGGFGSPIGTAFGALLFGMVSQGFFFTNIDSNWFLAFLGAMLLMAVGLNQYIRTESLKKRR